MSETKRGPDGETVGVDGPEPTLDTVRANIRAALVADADLLVHARDGVNPAGPQRPHDWPTNRIGRLVDAYVRLGGDLELPARIAYPPPGVGRVEPGLVDKVAEHAVRFVAELPGLEDALSHADILHGELERITAQPPPLPPTITEAST